MNIQDILKSDLLPVITGLYEYPHLIIDMRGNILYCNNAARDFLQVSASDKNIFDIFTGLTSELFYSLLKESPPRKEQPFLTQLQLHTGEVRTVQLRHSVISDGDEKYFSFTLSREQFRLRTSMDLKIISGTEKLNSDLLNLIQQNYPFTFLGKDSVRKKADEMREFFWIKDTEGKFILVNRAFSEYIGLPPEKIEGTEEKEHIPDHLRKLSESISEYVLKSGKGLRVSGILYGAYPYVRERMDIPLLNTDNKVYAIAGITSPADSASEKKDIFENMPSAAAVMNNEGTLVRMTEEFRRIFNAGREGTLHYRIIFPPEINAFIETFISSAARDDFKYFSGVDSLKQRFSSEIFVSLKKTVGDSEIFIYIDEQKTGEPMQEINNVKGKVYDILIQNNPEPVIIYERENLRFIEVNHSALSLYGYSKTEFLKMDLTDLYAPEDIQTLLSALNEKIKEGEFSGPFRQKKKDGSFIFVEISRFSLKYGSRDAHLNIVRDVTRRLQAEKEMQLFRSAFESTEQLVFVTDSSGFIKFVNNAVQSALGYAKTELEKISFTALVKDEARGNINSMVFRSQEKRSRNITAELKNSKGELKLLNLTITPVLDYKNEIDAFTILGSTKKEERVKEVTKEIVVERIMPADNIPPQESSLLLSSIFHEILTPINVILGFVQELTDSIGVMTPDQKEAAEIIKQNRMSLLNTMNSVIEYYNIEKKSPELKMARTAATEIIENLQHDFRELNRSRGIDILCDNIDPELYIETDKSKFSNLIFLLAKTAGYISKEKKIYIAMYPEDNSDFVITFRDTAGKLSPAFLEEFIKIFSPGAPNGAESGVPKLSLKLAGRLLGLFKGELYVREDNSEAGFIFPIRQELPKIKKITGPKEAEVLSKLIAERKPAVSEKVKTAPVTVTNLKLADMKCLYIEDQVDSQILYKVQMKELGDIQFAVSFEEALPLLDKQHFDFIVMDINLQGEYNGLDALRIIKKMPEYKNIPVIAVTAYLMQGDREKFISVGFSEFVAKPIFRDKMIEALEKVFPK